MADAPIVHVLGSNGLGGGELCALNLAQTLQEDGRSVRVWVPGEGPAADAAREWGLPTDTIDFSGVRSKSWPKQLMAHYRFRRALSKHKPKIVHVHAALMYGGLSRSLGTTRSVSHVQIDRKLSGLRWCFQRPPNLIVACAQFLADKVTQALSENGKQARVECIGNSVDLERFHDADKFAVRQALKLGSVETAPSQEHCTVILVLANLAPHKGQATAIRCTSWLQQQGVNVECWLAGRQRNGSDFETHLRNLSIELGIEDSIRFLGHRSDPEQLLQACDFLLLPSTNEGLPFTIVEAMATKRAVIAAPTAGIPEVVHDGETGFLVAADDAEGYGQAIQRLLESPSDHQNMVDQAFQFVAENYTWEVFVKRMTEYYDSLGEL